MNRWILVLCFFAYSTGTFAHQPDISTTMLVEKENNSWLLQIRGALTAFQYEVKAQYGENAYSSPEEFQELVIDHLKKNISINFKDGDMAIFESAYVKLGHETHVVFTIEGVPINFEKVDIKNTSFRDIHRNQSALVVLKKGFSKDQFVLNNANQHQASLTVEGNTFVLAKEKKPYASYLYLFIFLGAIVFMGVSYAVKKKPESIEYMI